MLANVTSLEFQLREVGALARKNIDLWNSVLPENFTNLNTYLPFITSFIWGGWVLFNDVLNP
jgi:hypothetical protein